MIWTVIMAARSFAAKIPWQLWAALAIILAAWLWGNHRYAQGYDDRTAEYAAAAAQAVAQARKADAAGMETAQAGKALSGAEIERGRDAAAKSTSDPWKAATEAMRPR